MDKNRRPGSRSSCPAAPAATSPMLPTPAGSLRRLARPAGSCTRRWPPWDRSRSSICSRPKGCRPRSSPAARSFPPAIGPPTCWRALVRRAKRSGCTLALGEAVVGRRTSRRRLPSASRRSERFPPKRCVLATGGQSYPACGTTGDGYRWAAALGHTIVAPRTALVPITSHASWLPPLQGITVADVAVKVIDPGELRQAGVPSRGPLAWPVRVDRCCSRISACRARWCLT